MKAIKLDLIRNARSILGSYESLSAYLVAEWAIGAHTAERLEDWFWTRGL